MKEASTSLHRTPTVGEEIANSLSHGIGLTLAIIATPFLIIAASRNGTALNIVGVAVFAASTISLYFASTVADMPDLQTARRLQLLLDPSVRVIQF